MKTEPNEPFMFCDALIKDSEEYIECIDESIKRYKQQQYMGLTKREYFAAMALQGLSANCYKTEDSNWKIAMDALTLADALIYELNKR